MYYFNGKDFSELAGQTIVKIEKGHNGDGNESLTIETSDGKKYGMSHSQDCCEYVYIESIIGELDDLLNTPILQAEVVCNTGEGEDVPEQEYPDESFTWTFYKLATIKGYVTIRWYGSSNGYYSESVDFYSLD